jgi:tetraacyldisaccharide 4'-kinase
MTPDAWLQQIWYGGRPAPWWLRALTPLFGLIVRSRRWLYAQGWCHQLRVAAPVIVVGNISVGGTGKTPLVIWLAGRLAALGLQVAVVSRGYGRHRGQDVVRLLATSRADEVGDEAMVIGRRAHCPVYVGNDRVRAAQAAVAAGATVLIADDGLQHLRLARDAEVVLVDTQRGFGNGALLPSGPLREPQTRLTTVSAVVWNVESLGPEAGGPGEQLVRPGVRMLLTGRELQAVSEAGRRRPLASFAGQRVHAVAGIGNPRRFFSTLTAAGLRPIEHPFPDHHPYLAADLHFGDDLPVIMTEKDAVKCQAFASAQCWCLPVTAQFAGADESALLGRILMDARLLDILVCPLCKGPLRLASEAAGKVLVCRADRLAYPIRDGIPVMLEEEARQLEATDPLLER